MAPKSVAGAPGLDGHAAPIRMFGIREIASGVVLRALAATATVAPVVVLDVLYARWPSWR